MTTDSLDLLWGDGAARRRGPKPALSVEKIVRAAIDIADAEGLDMVSIQRVAGRLGCSTMALYRHVPGKSQLIDVMMDTAASPPPDLSAAQGWRARIELWVQALWARYQQHPWMLQVQISGPPLGPNQLSWLEASLSALADTGLTNDEMLATCLFLNGAVTGLARLSTDVAQAAENTGVRAEEAGAQYVRTLETLIDSERFPVLTDVVRTGAMRPASDARGADVPDFHFGLQQLLDGLEARIQRRKAERREAAEEE
ncbi:TetR/AcrR family transcriptional regulator [Streptomyces tendae]|uniref:TetR/AcrR family transcriptional regulator n=1 Tax=Streptomyces tendae TaxID=1932 RepID=UPI0033B10CCC